MNLDVEQIIREFIDKTVHMSLATSSGNKPWVCEVHFGYDQNLNLYFVSERSTRHCREIEANPLVAGNIVKQHELTESPNGIYFEGEAEYLPKPTPEQITAYCSRLNRDESELSSFLSQGGKGMYQVTISKWAVFGKFGSEKNAKHELKWDGGNK